ncbi:cinnamoyl-CoA reductase-like SNL6 isoform X2 [Cryptomeria japonica]|uniref:cinnamoyl-CoA reductase-like SNL6 isoform X2 n=1 Tax=Cryptomeria japonica TaxID=3369 RepID=UPI0027DA8F47|nr:cinnamoyl-CoA reductase-like SNL6 isoform X2 [Cryptomeria japonica]
MAVLSASSKRVCVVGASTYVGIWIVKGLLLRGYTVHAATFQHGGGESETARKLIEMGRGNEGLKLFAADVLDYHSIVDALEGCCGLFYAFDQIQNASGYDERMVKVEVRGAHNVLEACAQTETIKKVVFTSCLSAVIWRGDKKSTEDLDERFWSDEGYCREIKLWYALAKTLAEKAAWALAMDRELNMVTINAALIVGPGFSTHNSASTLAYLKAQMYEDGVLASVDVRYVADAHICVFEDPSSYGRHICFNQIVNCAQHAVDLAKSLRPLVTLPESWEDSRVYPQRLSNIKLSKLMVGIECQTMKLDGSQF